MPAGFELVPANSGDSGAKASSTRAACAPLVRLLNSTKVGGSTATAEVSFSGGQDGPFIDESLDAMGSAAAAAAFVRGYRQDVTRCNAVTLAMAGMGSSVMQVREVSFASVGDDSFAARFVASSGAMKGFELIQVGVQLQDVVAGLTFIAADPADAEAATKVAVQKATSVLSASTT